MKMYPNKIEQANSENTEIMGIRTQARIAVRVRLVKVEKVQTTMFCLIPTRPATTYNVSCLVVGLVKTRI